MTKKIQLFHNPGAGLGEHSGEELARTIESYGYQCRHVSIKDKNWEQMPADTDWIAVAGGDGTVKRIVQMLGNRKAENRLPVGLLPLGTANNIATSLHISGKPGDIVSTWGKDLTSFDVGKTNWGRHEQVFGEAAGFGLFPWHMAEMQKMGSKKKSLEEKLRYDKECFIKHANNYKALFYEVEIDGKRYDGEYLMVEIMNIPRIGSNLLLSENADPGDGWLQVVMLKESDREQLTGYLEGRLNGHERRIDALTVPARKVVVNNSAKYFHIDDETLDHDPNMAVTITIDPEPLHFLT